MSAEPRMGNKSPSIETPRLRDDSYGLSLPDFPNVNHSYLQEWPDEERSEILLDAILTSIGRVQHFFDPRSVADRLAMCSASNGQEPPTTLWYIELLLVFAIGDLLTCKFHDRLSTPGESYFIEAMNRIPGLSHLRTSGIQGIEILGLVTYYLQCADRRDDAYVYAGVALRMALLMGLHRDSGAAATTRSDKTHQNRLWWTIYMQERRLAAATGNPLSVDDEVIRAALPRDAPGFCASEALTTNVKIAKITGQTLKNIYGSIGQTEQIFMTHVQNILSELHQISQNMPADFAVDFSQQLRVTRTSATLYLMLYQAIILVTRPILLQLARQAVKEQLQNIILSRPLESLAETCIDAARHTLRILCALKQQQLLANFGFSDLDAIFSAGFVFVLAETIYPSSHRHSGLSGIRGCLDLLQDLNSHGNRPSAVRRRDIIQMCKQLNIAESLTNTEPSGGVTIGDIEAASSVRVNNGQQKLQQETDAQVIAMEQPLHWVDDIAESEMLLGQDTHDLHLWYNHDSLDLTGAIETDWEALATEIFRSG
ncbi:uncharacterized protein A1O9_08932 [Exophiala aquamarina CBS 119918]|uniref:Xylanolytic transcriptional activator regulatory domain-containing protein n=1 Tax=Exophiala aquamarina CBS 119918 TaxID=1182545 RepID=A0A072P7Q3_9EURO|nr:uncharacterized protein A1O9_08932 [Exophiala aquamarina CBS 119918]KEF55278.1 hypothetical protein A1O9_08932 [Exophiala aquamarina CBS 119918]